MERKDMKLGFIGFGNMAQAIAEGLLRSKALEPEQIQGRLNEIVEKSPIHREINGESRNIICSDVVVACGEKKGKR